jgi:hypothetical protein
MVKSLREDGFDDVTLLGGGPLGSIPSTYDVVICRRKSCSHEAYEVCKAASKAGRTVIFQDGSTEALRAVQRAKAATMTVEQLIEAIIGKGGLFCTHIFREGFVPAMYDGTAAEAYARKLAKAPMNSLKNPFTRVRNSGAYSEGRLQIPKKKAGRGHYDRSLPVLLSGRTSIAYQSGFHVECVDRLAALSGGIFHFKPVITEPPESAGFKPKKVMQVGWIDPMRVRDPYPDAAEIIEDAMDAAAAAGDRADDTEPDESTDESSLIELIHEYAKARGIESGEVLRTGGVEVRLTTVHMAWGDESSLCANSNSRIDEMWATDTLSSVTCKRCRSTPAFKHALHALTYLKL